MKDRPVASGRKRGAQLRVCLSVPPHTGALGPKTDPFLHGMLRNVSLYCPPAQLGMAFMVLDRNTIHTQSSP